MKIAQIRDREHSDGFFQLDTQRIDEVSSASKGSRDDRRSLPQSRRISKKNTTNIPVVMQRQVLVIQKAPRTVDITLLQYSDATVDVPVTKQCREDATGTPRGLHDEIQRNPDEQEAAFSICSRPRTRSRMSSTVKVGATCVVTVQKDTEVI